VAIPQNTKIWHQTQANMFGNSKPDSKPKWFTPWISKR
jgi:hypothetical protein